MKVIDLKNPEKFSPAPDAIHQQLSEQFQGLSESLLTFAESFESDRLQGYPFWAPELPQAFEPTADWIKRLYLSLFYQDRQDPKETLSHHGLIGASPTTLTLAQQVNENKDKFKAIVNEIKLQYPQAVASLTADLATRHPAIYQALKHQTLSRLHLKQCYRHLPLLLEAPHKVGFVWALKNRSIIKITAAQAEAKLLKLDEEKSHIQVQLNALRQLNPKEVMRLRKVQELQPCVKVNVVFKTGRQVTKRLVMSSPMPILFPSSPGEALPPYNPLPLECPDAYDRQARNDKGVGETLFLPSIQVHLTRPRPPY